MESVRVRKYEVWKQQALFDLASSKVSLEAHFYEWATYQAIQSIEKFLKGIIALSGFVPPRTHKLSLLYRIIQDGGHNLLVSMSEIKKIEVFTYLARYPFLSPLRTSEAIPHNLIKKEDAVLCQEIAQKVFDSINNINFETQEVRVIPREYYDRKLVSQYLQNIVSTLLGQKKFDIAEIRLYGSFSRDYAQEINSTVDILIVIESDSGVDFIERIRFFRQILDISPLIVDCLVYTRAEIEFLLNDIREGYLESAFSESKLLYSKIFSSV